ncbi:MAG: hypothetical protein NXI19_01625 [Alphaproteobacteria bacterium]|nr:hypothetical protein [Alphaproteobacteria bacterium]
MTDVFLNLAGRFLIGATLLLIPLLGVYASRLIWRVPSLAFFDRIPLLSQLSTGFGILLGFGVFITNEARPAYEINTIVEAGGPWDLPWRVYLSTIGDPALYDYAPLWAQLSLADLPMGWMVYGLCLAALGIASLLSVLLLLRGIEVVIGLFGIVFAALIGQMVTTYLITLLPYTLNTLNFWSAALALVVLQFYRYAGKKD